MKDQTKYKHWTNGTDNIFSEVCPTGWWNGITNNYTEEQKKQRALNHSKAVTGKKFYNNGIKNILIFPDSDIPEGFHEGYLPLKKRNSRQKSKSLAFINTLNDEDRLQFELRYRNNSDRVCCEYYGVSAAVIKSAAKHLNITRTTEEENSIKKQTAILKRQKTEKTCLEKYGTRTPAESEDIKKKLKNTYIEKYGVSTAGRGVWILNNAEYSEFFKSIVFDKTKSEEFLRQHNKEYTRNDLCKMFQCPIHALNNWLYSFNLQDYTKYAPSHYEDEIIELFPNIKSVRNDRTHLLGGKEIDIFFPEYNIGIEFNGTYWHKLSNVGSKDYHFNKSKEAQNSGIRLIHIYEYEWLDPLLRSKIESLLNIALHSSGSRIYARKCSIREITNNEAKDFNNKNHLQGHRNAQVTYGLFYNDKLVQLMSFSKTKYNKNLKGDDDWEIIRGCPGSNNIVVGGVSKLFSYFIKQHNPAHVFSYCDFNKFDGVGYEALGMKFIGYTGPDKKWVLPGDVIANRQPSKYKELKDSAIDTIWGAGSKKYLWSKEEQIDASN